MLRRLWAWFTNLFRHSVPEDRILDSIRSLLENTGRTGSMPKQPVFVMNNATYIELTRLCRRRIELNNDATMVMGIPIVIDERVPGERVYLMNRMQVLDA